jgi:hypothetical protein
MNPEVKEFMKRANPDYIHDSFHTPITFIFTDSGQLLWKYGGVHSDILIDNPAAVPAIFKNHPNLQQQIRATPSKTRELVDKVAISGRLAHGVFGPRGAAETFNVLALWDSQLLSKLPQLIEALKLTTDREGKPLIDDNYIVTIVGQTPMIVKELRSSAGHTDPCQQITFQIDNTPWKLSKVQAALHQTKGTDLVKIKCGICPGINKTISDLETRGCDSVAAMVRDISNRLRCGRDGEGTYCMAAARSELKQKLGDPAYTNSLPKRELERQWDMIRPECVLHFREWLNQKSK